MSKIAEQVRTILAAQPILQTEHRAQIIGQLTTLSDTRRTQLVEDVVALKNDSEATRITIPFATESEFLDAVQRIATEANALRARIVERQRKFREALLINTAINLVIGCAQ